MNKYSEVEIHDFRYLQIETYLLVEIWLNMASFSIYSFFSGDHLELVQNSPGDSQESQGIVY